jgi:hypothetical protein
MLNRRFIFRVLAVEDMMTGCVKSLLPEFNAGAMRPTRTSSCQGDSEHQVGSEDISQQFCRIAFWLPARPSRLLPRRHLLSRACESPSKPRFVALERVVDRRPAPN